MEEKIRELFSNSAFAEKVMAMETPEEVKVCLAENGIECSVEEILQVRQLLEKKANGELTEEDLENVSGGCMCLFLIVPSLIGVSGALFGTLYRRRW